MSRETPQQLEVSASPGGRPAAGAAPSAQRESVGSESAWTEAVFLSGLVLGALALSIVLIRVTGQGDLPMGLGVIALTLGVGALLAGRGSRLGPLAALAVVAVLGVALSSFGIYSLFAVVLALAHGALFRRRREPALGLLLATIGPLEANFAVVAEPRIGTLAMVGAQLLLSLGGLALLHRSVVVATAPRTALRRRWISEGQRQPAQPRAAFGVALTVLAVAMLFQTAGSMLARAGGPAPIGGSGETGGAADGAGLDSGASEAVQEDPWESRFPGEIDLSASPLGGSDRVVTLTGPDVQQRAVWLLRVLVFDRLNARGFDSSVLGREQLVADGDDGRRDGWVRRSPRSEDEGLLSVEVSPLGLGASGRQPLLRPASWTAVEVEPVRRHTGGVLTTEGPQAGARYRVQFRSGESAGERLELAVDERERSLELPVPQNRTERAFDRRVRRLSEEIFGSDPDARRAVRQLEAVFLRGSFVYDLSSTGEAGVERLDTFLNRREGSCTHFASLAVWLLRAAGIPARAVGGFRAATWETPSRCIASRSDAHAWCELWIEGRGWVEFDLTPEGASPPNSSASSSAEEPESVPESRELTPLQEAVRRFREEERFGFGEFLAATAAQVPLGRVLPWTLGALALLAGWKLRTRRARTRGEVHGSGAGSAEAGALRRAGAGILGRLLDALEKLGAPRPLARTPAEWVRELRPRIEGDEGRLEEVLGAAYRERFGGSWQTADLPEQDVDSALAGLRLRDADPQDEPPSRA